MKPLVAILIIVALGVPALAGTIPPSLSISGSVDLDEAYLTDPDHVDTMIDGDIGKTVGGTTTTSLYDETGMLGANPLSDSLLATGDGFGASATISTFSDAAEFGVGIDWVIDLTNSSATETHTVTFKVGYSNAVDADGPDAYSSSELSVESPAGVTEVFFTHLVSDTFFGDEAGGGTLGEFLPTGGSGAALSDSGMSFFSVVLAPGAMASIEAFWNGEGGTFDTGSSATLTFGTFLSVDSITTTGGPGPTVVPLPSAAWLGLALLGGLGAVRSSRKRRTRSN